MTRSIRGHIAPLSVAPMMDRTDRFFRVFMRQLTRETLLYTEMVTTHAILHGDRERLLGYHPIEHPISLQLGGGDPAQLAECARIAEGMGYDEVNINVGCPSDRVQSGAFGVCLMRTPQRVAEGVAAMRAAVSIPVTVKHRIGVDELDRYEDMHNFVAVVSQANADRFTVHARKAWLKGLSPKENRNVPPIRYEDVYQLKRELPHLDIEINGHIKSLAETQAHLEQVDAVMIGRAACDNPYLFAEADSMIFGTDRPAPTRVEVVCAMQTHIAQALRPIAVKKYVRGMLNLFAGIPGARRWKRVLTEGSKGRSVDPGIIGEALAAVQAVQRRQESAA